MQFNLEALNQAFDKAETETADWFNQQTCSMENKHGENECPICYFRARVKEHLNAIPSTPAQARP